MNDCNLVYYDGIVSRDIRWLWYPYIPAGKITIVQGDPGEGKTTFILSLLSVLSRGGTLPYSNEPVSGYAIYQNMEDDNADTIKPRLERHGADCSKICFIETSDGRVSLEDDLERAVRDSNAKILVLDPIQSFLGENTDMNRANSVRPKMNRLKELAENTGCAVVLVGHLNKNSGGKANYRGLGSIDFSAAARSILAIGRPWNDPGIRVLAHQKSNLAPLGRSLAFSLSDGKVEWIGPYAITAEELFSPASGDRGVPKSVEAERFITSFLNCGERSFNDVVAAGEKEGICKRALLRAKEQMNVSSVKHKDGWYWRLPRPAGSPAGGRTIPEAGTE